MEVKLSSVATRSSLQGQFHRSWEVSSFKLIKASKLMLTMNLTALSIIVNCYGCDTNTYKGT